MNRNAWPFILAALIAGTSSRAAIDASVSLSELQVQLIDLDPLDGIAPEITFGSGWTRGSSIIQLGWELKDQKLAELPDAFHDLSGSASWNSVSSWFTLNGSGTLSGATVSSTLGYGLDKAPSEYFAVLTDGSFSVEFLLTPKTELLVSALVQSSIRSSTFESVSNDVKVTGLIEVIKRPFPYDIALDWSDLSASNPTQGQVHDKAERLNISYSNDTVQEISGSLNARTSLVAILAPVPEPSIAALFGAGLSALCWMTRRRQGSQSIPEVLACKGLVSGTGLQAPPWASALAADCSLCRQPRG